MIGMALRHTDEGSIVLHCTRELGPDLDAEVFEYVIGWIRDGWYPRSLEDPELCERVRDEFNYFGYAPDPETQLYEAVRNVRVPTVQWLLNAGVVATRDDLELVLNPVCSTPLFIRCPPSELTARNTVLAFLLVCGGSNVMFKGALDEAVNRGLHGIVRVLLEAGMSVYNSVYVDHLGLERYGVYAAIVHADLAMLRLLVEDGNLI